MDAVRTADWTERAPISYPEPSCFLLRMKALGMRLNEQLNQRHKTRACTAGYFKMAGFVGKTNAEIKLAIEGLRFFLTLLDKGAFYPNSVCKNFQQECKREIRLVR